jgi:hypothetical protein
VRSYALQAVAIRRILGEIRRHIQARLDRDASAKSVVNMSWGKRLYSEVSNARSLILRRSRDNLAGRSAG